MRRLAAARTVLGSGAWRQQRTEGSVPTQPGQGKRNDRLSTTAGLIRGLAPARQRGGAFRRCYRPHIPTPAHKGSPVDTDHDQVRRVIRQNSRSFPTDCPCCRGLLPACSPMHVSATSGAPPTPEASPRSAVAAYAGAYFTFIIPCVAERRGRIPLRLKSRRGMRQQGWGTRRAQHGKLSPSLGRPRRARAVPRRARRGDP